jgi:hypothetical protein
LANGAEVINIAVQTDRPHQASRANSEDGSRCNLARKNHESTLKFSRDKVKPTIRAIVITEKYFRRVLQHNNTEARLPFANCVEEIA